MGFSCYRIQTVMQDLSHGKVRLDQKVDETK